MYALGYDVGSSFIKASIINAENGTVVAAASYPDKEMPITSPVAGWAEQDPDSWWDAIVGVTRLLAGRTTISLEEVRTIGISYQMHGLVLVDRDLKPLRSSIIWCDSRATEIGRKAFSEIGEGVCLKELLNSPGNFTASKLRWVKLNEPQVYAKIHKMLLPGEYIALRLSGECKTTASGLSEGMFWNFPANDVSDRILSYYDMRRDLLADRVPSIGYQGSVTASAARELGLKAGIPIAYRAGDQPNNAFSLNVLEPGEIAATAGTSGVVYAVSGSLNCDPQSRINAFAHVNHTPQNPRVGILLCINGTGISNSWIRRLSADGALSYEKMNELASIAAVGSRGLSILPFGNGAERMLGDKEIGASFHGLNFNVHSRGEVFRAVQEGVACSFKYGIDIMQSLAIRPSVLRAGAANMFLSPIFCKTLASLADVRIELYNTDGAQGAARAAAVGAGLIPSVKDAFRGLSVVGSIEPESNKADYFEAYDRWLTQLNLRLQN
ncbi:MAG TPA: FGGY family carbohydrate kinase [Bacteroidota bacterium]|nr:FGGY family carbohydrate kinase [Bacteroidota bacterium]